MDRRGEDRRHMHEASRSGSRMDGGREGEELEVRAVNPAKDTKGTEDTKVFGHKGLRTRRSSLRALRALRSYAVGQVDGPRRLMTAAAPKRARTSTFARMSLGNASKFSAMANGNPSGRIQRTRPFLASNRSSPRPFVSERAFRSTARCSQYAE